jgi:hypothetical protein
MENEKSIWNKTIFSETPNRYDDNFQIMNMKQKIKKIKKPKIKKENYKNIEELENIYDIPSSPPKIVEGLRSKSINNDLDPNFLGLPDKDFDGIDSPDKGNKDDPRVGVINILNKLYEQINKFNYTIALYIAKILSIADSNENNVGELLRKGANSRKLNQKQKDSKNDILIIQKYVGLFESVLVAFFATYNWFYIMFYYYTNQDKENNIVNDEKVGCRVDVPKLSSYYIQEQIHQRADFLSIFYAFVNFFFIFALAFVEYLQSFMMKIIPDNLRSVLNYKGCFVAVFVLFILFFFNFNVFIYNFLIAVLRGDTKNIVVSIMYFFLLIIYFFGNYNMGFLPKTLNYTVNSFMGFILSPLTSFITAFLRFIIVMLISVPIGAVACILYLLFNSLFGIMMNVNIFSYFGTFFRIHEFIKHNNDPDVNKKDDIIHKVKSSYNNLIDFIYKYVFFIAYIFILVIAIIDYNNNITNSQLKFRLIIFSAIVIFIMLIAMLGISSIKNFMVDESGKTVYDESGKPIVVNESSEPTAKKTNKECYDDTDADYSLNNVMKTVMDNIFTKFANSKIPNFDENIMTSGVPDLNGVLSNATDILDMQNNGNEKNNVQPFAPPLQDTSTKNAASNIANTASSFINKFVNRNEKNKSPNFYTNTLTSTGLPDLNRIGVMARGINMQNNGDKNNEVVASAPEYANITDDMFTNITPSKKTNTSNIANVANSFLNNLPKNTSK